MLVEGRVELRCALAEVHFDRVRSISFDILRLVGDPEGCFNFSRCRSFNTRKEFGKRAFTHPIGTYDPENFTCPDRSAVYCQLERFIFFGHCRDFKECFTL